MAVTDPTKGAKGITSFIVEKDFPGFKLGNKEKKMGLHGSHTWEIFFEDCEVPVENMLGEEGKARERSENSSERTGRNGTAQKLGFRR